MWFIYFKQRYMSLCLQTILIEYHLNTVIDTDKVDGLLPTWWPRFHSADPLSVALRALLSQELVARAPLQAHGNAFAPAV
ncbi:MAG TPA: hypothetical protein VLD59_16465, partial [Steroidobacteraceae bacterium]|nr:hypothetical protein [Steroidobacteraceae bacterium]